MYSVSRLAGRSVEFMSAFFKSALVNAAFCERTRPARPATWGVAIDVPSQVSQPPPGTVLVMSAPGAERSTESCPQLVKAQRGFELRTALHSVE
jgi:hypothetical protein